MPSKPNESPGPADPVLDGLYKTYSRLQAYETAVDAYLKTALGRALILVKDAPPYVVDSGEIARNLALPLAQKVAVVYNLISLNPTDPFLSDPTQVPLLEEQRGPSLVSKSTAPDPAEPAEPTLAVQATAADLTQVLAAEPSTLEPVEEVPSARLVLDAWQLAVTRKAEFVPPAPYKAFKKFWRGCATVLVVDPQAQRAYILPSSTDWAPDDYNLRNLFDFGDLPLDVSLPPDAVTAAPFFCVEPAQLQGYDPPQKDWKRNPSGQIARLQEASRFVPGTLNRSAVVIDKARPQQRLERAQALTLEQLRSRLEVVLALRNGGHFVEQAVFDRTFPPEDLQRVLDIIQETPVHTLVSTHRIGGVTGLSTFAFETVGREGKVRELRFPQDSPRQGYRNSKENLEQGFWRGKAPGESWASFGLPSRVFDESGRSGVDHLEVFVDGDSPLAELIHKINPLKPEELRLLQTACYALVALYLPRGLLLTKFPSSLFMVNDTEVPPPQRTGGPVSEGVGASPGSIKTALARDNTAGIPKRLEAWRLEFAELKRLLDVHPFEGLPTL